MIMTGTISSLVTSSCGRRRSTTISALIILSEDTLLITNSSFILKNTRRYFRNNKKRKLNTFFYHTNRILFTFSNILNCSFSNFMNKGKRDDKGRTRDDKGQVRVIGGKLLPYELNHSPTDACQSLQLPH